MKRLGWILGLGIPAGVAAWIAAGTFLPLPQAPGRVEFLFFSPSYLWLALAICAGIAAVAMLDLGRREFAPAILLASLDPLALLAFVPGGSAIAGPLVFLAVDLRRWRVAVAALLLVHALDRERHFRWSAAVRAMWSRLSPRVRLHVLDAALCALAVAFAVSTTTFLRFSDLLHGDEPKYVRYCENLYQGNGFDLTDFKDAAKIPAEPSHIFRNAAYILPTAALEAKRAERDVRTYFRDPDFRFNRGKFIDGWFIYSKVGRIFQVHTPGVSILMLPFYYIDRVWLSGGAMTYQGQVAGKLLATNTYFLLMYALLGVVTFRLLRNWLGGEWLPWLLAALSIASMPLAAFAFQMYPETTAGVFTIATVNFLVFKAPARTSIAAAAFYGALAGYLPWLHVRFMAVALVLIVWALFVFRRRPSAAAAFAASWAVLVAALSVHVFHITGSPLPNALYTVEGVRESLSLAGVPVGLRGFALDRGYGLLSYSPYYALALAGVWTVFLRDRAASGFALAVLLAAAVSGATHSWTAAGGSPLRYLIAVMPLALVPLGAALQQVGSSKLVAVAFAAAAVLALQNAVAYNNYHPKTTGPMVDESVSGWKVNLLFPDIKTGRSAADTSVDYLPPTDEAWRRVTEVYAAHPCALCLSSRHGVITTLAALKPGTVR